MPGTTVEPLSGRQRLEHDGWTIAKAPPFINRAGPMWQKIEHDRTRYGILISHRHDNTQGRPHGGLIMSLCDNAMGNYAQAARPDARLFTISFECQFIGGSVEGEFIEARCEVVKATRSLVFMRSTCVVGERVVAAASGTWKAVTS